MRFYFLLTLSSHVHFLERNQNFDRSFDTRQKLSFFNKKLGIKKEEMVDLANLKDESRLKMTGWTIDELIPIFDKRHQIVHNNAFPIQNIDELGVIADFFIHVISILGMKVASKFNIPTDFDMFKG